MASNTLSRISPPDLNNLMSILDVQVTALSECLVSPGYKLEVGENPSVGIHYIMNGYGRMIVERGPTYQLKPHTLVVMPPNTAFVLEVATETGEAMKTARTSDQNLQIDSIRRFIAGEDEPKTLMICGYFKALYGASIDLFNALSSPILEQFAESDRLDQKMVAALDELRAQEVGAGAMSGALLKQVVVALLRRSLSSINIWVERFAMLSDPLIARAFADMVANPGAPHSTHSLADRACLSRSAFMARFTATVGKSPMLILRDLRMRQAATQLASGRYTIDQVSYNAGYSSRSSFVRAFKGAFGADPSEYKSGELTL